MSSPNHPTCDIEDDFSSNFPNYIPASLNYFPASSRNTSSESSNNSSDFFHPEEIPPPKDTETPIESPIPISLSSSVVSSSPVRSTTPPPDYPFDESIFAKIDNSLWIIPRPMGSEPFLEESNESHACLNAAIKKLVADSIAATLEEVANIAQRLMDHVLKDGSVQGTNDHK
ncbi:hypothetical protein Tco_0751719 [Tanacetum coccineum]|uniref:Uncharacterized protein n=1 Tax=Tanacetum coccineum TaxID=301880 RepID=A0ABQ4Z8H3_9ASTR